jgi:hypothetical protein
MTEPFEANDDAILRAITMMEALEGDLGVAGFFSRISSNSESDWSLVVKLNALFEAALIHVLTDALGIDALEGQFRTMQHSRRIEFAEASGVLRPSTRRFMTTLNSLRNAFAHRVENIDQSIVSYVATLTPNRADEFRDGINAISDAPAQNLRSLAEKHPRTMMLVSAMATLAHLHEIKTKISARRESSRRATAAFDALSKVAEQALKAAGVDTAALERSTEPSAGPSKD